MATTTLRPRLVLPVSERDHVQGPDDAPFTLVEYGDYECPYCRLVYDDIQGLQEQLGDRLRYVYRHLPIESAHPHARLAAEAAEAAGAQGKFWEMHDALYTHDDLNQARIYDFAEAIGLDMVRFRQELEAGVYAERVHEDFRSGIRSGANGTPTFFVNGERYDGPWDLESLLEVVERPLGVRARMLTDEFTRLAASGGIVLLIATILALFWANSPLAESYFTFWETPLAFSFGDFSLSEHLLGWVNDGLMVIFFFVVGLEIKREILSGELAEPKHAALPVAAALGGMILPAAIYTFFNWDGPGLAGWGIPMATDIAFTLGILTVLGNRVPFSLKVFFTALAIADDLGAILVIALFYTAEISWLSLGVAGLFFLALVGLNRARVRAVLPYSLLGIGLWLAFLESGVHPTIAGVLLALTIPTRSPPEMRGLLLQAVTLLDSFELPVNWQGAPDSRRQAAAQRLESIADRMQSPAQQLETGLAPWSTYVVLPIFALANAGVALGGQASPSLLSPVSMGIILGLVVGKPLGISLFAWSAVRLGLAELPGGVTWRQLFAASCLAGIGFTISLFIAGAAFADPALIATAKVAILVASILAALLGTLLLFLTSPSHAGATEVAGGTGRRAEVGA
ncbi:MAG TPA: Na+/H+ antiporter NhaA [Anaerolineae bacterium]